MAETAMDDYARKLQLADVLREPVIKSAVLDLRLDDGDRILDAGCGIGSHLSLLAEQVGESGRVTGLDVSAEMISHAADEISRRGLADRVSLVQGDVNSLPFAEGTFDCVVSVDCVGYPYSSNPVSLLQELKRVASPGGAVALLGWTYQQLLPGYALLESKLNTQSSLVLPTGSDMEPENHLLRAPGWFREAGFVDVGARSYAGDISAPMSEEGKEAVQALFQMLWADASSALSDEEWLLFRLISEPGAGDYILNRPDYYGFFVYTCFSGSVPAT